MIRALVVLIPVILALFGPADIQAQPVTGTGPDNKMMWKQITLDAYDTAEALRSGELGQDWRAAMIYVAQDQPVLFWVVVDYAQGYPPEDPLAEVAVADLAEALAELYRLSLSEADPQAEGSPLLDFPQLPFLGPELP